MKKALARPVCGFSFEVDGCNTNFGKSAGLSSDSKRLWAARRIECATMPFAEVKISMSVAAYCAMLSGAALPREMWP